MPTCPLLMEPDELEARLDDPELLIVDLCKPEIHVQGHIPGALHLDYADVVCADPPVMGLLPDADQVSRLAARLGLTPGRCVVTYDDEGGGKAARLLWTLVAYGHQHISLLNGGHHAWANEGHPMTQDEEKACPSDYRLHDVGDVVADADYIRQHLQDPGVALLDARTPDEFRGLDRRAAHGGHIPGAVNLEWTQAMDNANNLRVKDRDVLMPMLEQMGITPDKEVITYCQTHHRSAHTWLVLKTLGFDRVRGYPGAWSDWGNRNDLPVEC
ncbi:MAG TPA: sulfurtransferase [Thioalkalivibrio sp.]|nr:sulfurtransferase [Thioalkalivibrio sp.]